MGFKYTYLVHGAMFVVDLLKNVGLFYKDGGALLVVVGVFFRLSVHLWIKPLVRFFVHLSFFHPPSALHRKLFTLAAAC
jgi:hypothetical protein